jgi:hypothetical protein
MTLTFDLDLDSDFAKRCLSYVSIIILSSTGIDPFFLYEFSKFRNKYGRCDLYLQDIKKILKTGLANVPLYPPTKFHSDISSRF